MKLRTYCLAGTLLIASAARPQETQVLVQNEQITVEATKYSASCEALLAGKGNPNSGAATSTCTELAITNHSRSPITAWVTTTGRDSQGAAPRVSTRGIRASDSVIFNDDRRIDPLILSRDTHRVIMGNPMRVDFKAAVFEDGSVFGAAEWVNRIVQNRRQVYQELAEALKHLRAARQAGTPREQIIQEFQELDQKERATDQANLRTLPLAERLPLPKLGIYTMVAADLAPERGGGPTLADDISRVDSILLGIGNSLLVSRPAISDHPVSLGEPLESPSSAGRSGEPTQAH